MRSASLVAVISSAVLAIPAALAVSSNDVMQNLRIVLIPRTEKLVAAAKYVYTSDFVLFPTGEGVLSNIYYGVRDLTEILVKYSTALDSVVPFTNTTAARDIIDLFINLNSRSYHFADEMTEAVDRLEKSVNGDIHLGATAKSIQSVLINYKDAFDAYAGNVSSVTSLEGSTDVKDNLVTFDLYARIAIAKYRSVI